MKQKRKSKWLIAAVGLSGAVLLSTCTTETQPDLLQNAPQTQEFVENLHDWQADWTELPDTLATPANVGQKQVPITGINAAVDALPPLAGAPQASGLLLESGAGLHYGPQGWWDGLMRVGGSGISGQHLQAATVATLAAVGPDTARVAVANDAGISMLSYGRENEYRNNWLYAYGRNRINGYLQNAINSHDVVSVSEAEGGPSDYNRPWLYQQNMRALMLQAAGNYGGAQADSGAGANFVPLAQLLNQGLLVGAVERCQITRYSGEDSSVLASNPYVDQNLQFTYLLPPAAFAARLRASTDVLVFNAIGNGEFITHKRSAGDVRLRSGGYSTPAKLAHALENLESNLRFIGGSYAQKAALPALIAEGRALSLAAEAGNSHAAANQEYFRRALPHLERMIVAYRAALPAAIDNYINNGYTPKYLAGLPDANLPRTALRGTSFSTPYLAGLALRLKAAQPSLNNAELELALLLAAEPIRLRQGSRNVAYISNGAGRLFAPSFGGFGMVDEARLQNIGAQLAALKQQTGRGVQPVYITQTQTAQADADGWRFDVNADIRVIQLTLDIAASLPQDGWVMVSPAGTRLPVRLRKIGNVATLEQDDSYRFAATEGFLGEGSRGVWRLLPPEDIDPAARLQAVATLRLNGDAPQGLLARALAGPAQGGINFSTAPDGICADAGNPTLPIEMRPPAPRPPDSDVTETPSVNIPGERIVPKQPKGALPRLRFY